MITIVLNARILTPLFDRPIKVPKHYKNLKLQY